MYKIKTEHLNAILQYLGRQPYADVARLIQYVQEAEQINPYEENVQHPSTE